MKKYLPLVFSALFPIVCSGATPWQKWGGTYIRLQDDGNVACVKHSDNKNCIWNAGDTVPAATASALVCGASLKETIWRVTGYDMQGHWCNNAYGDLFATWRRGDYFGTNVFLAQNPQGDVMCASNDGINCAWDNLINDRYPERPVKPLVCGVAHDSVWGDGATNAPGHWCQQARYTIDELDFSDRRWATERFNYGAGWAGTGFGLSGTQRGAPESMRIGVQEGRKGLAILSQERTNTWWQSEFNGSPTGMYAKADVELQDDLFMYTKSPWVAGELPAVVMHVYLTKGNTTSLRMPVTYQRDGKTRNRWPGIWLKPDGLAFRTVKSDFQMASLVPSSSAGTWWTLGLKVTASGDMEYYAAPDWRVSPFDSASLRAKQSLLLNDDSYKIISQSDAVVMVSSVIRNSSPIVIGDIRYAKKGALSMDEPEK